MRKDNWRSEFERIIDEIKAKPFDWQDQFDCLLGLVAPTVNAITDGDPYFARYVGKYKTARGALGLMKRLHFATLADVVAAELPEIHPSQCRVGDVAAIPVNDGFGFSLGIVNGDRVFVMMESRLGTRDLLDATRAFRVV